MADGKLIFDTSINTNGFESDLEGLEKSVKFGGYTVGKNIKSILGAGLIKEAGTALFEFGKESINAASDLQEVDNVINTTFGENAPLIDAFAKGATKSLGMTETAAKKYTGTFGAILKAMGMTDDQTLEFSQNLTSLAADLASFYNIDFESAYQKLRSGLVGETEPLMDLGIDLRVTALEEYAEGLGLVYSEMSSAEQAALRYAAIMDKTGDVQGDFAKTNDSFSNQMKVFETNIANLQAALGEQLLPVMNTVLSFFNGLFETSEKDMTITDKLSDVTSQFEAFNTAVEAAEANFETTESTLESRAALAETYMNTLETLEGKEIKTDEDVAAINNAVTALNTLYPNLQLTMDPATGSLNLNTEAIRANISALQDLAMQDLFAGQWKENAAALAQAYDNLAGASSALEDAKQPLQDIDQQIEGVQSVFDQLMTNGFSGVNAYAGQYASLIPSFDNYFKQNMDGSYSLIDPGMLDPSVITTDAQNALAKLNAERNDILAGIADAQAAVDGYNQAITDIQANQAAIAEKQETVKNLMQTAGQDAVEAEAQGVTDSADTVATAVDTVTSDAAKNADTTALYDAGVAGALAYASGLKSVSMPTLRAKTDSTSTDGTHYSGLNYVPHDGYLARLHVGEAVLSASEARSWRSNESNGGGNVMAAVGAALSVERSRPIDLYVNGKRFAEFTVADNSRALAQDNMRSAKGVGRK